MALRFATLFCSTLNLLQVEQKPACAKKMVKKISEYKLYTHFYNLARCVYFVVHMYLFYGAPFTMIIDCKCIIT